MANDGEKPPVRKKDMEGQSSGESPGWSDRAGDTPSGVRADEYNMCDECPWGWCEGRGGREEGPVQMNNRVGNVCAHNTAKLQGQ